MNFQNRMPLVAIALAASVAFGAVAIAHDTDKKTPESKAHSMAGMNHSMAGMSEGSQQLHQVMMSGMKMPMKMTGNVDTDFATMMTMHHQQAIQMADVLLKYGKTPELRALAQKMKASQMEEIKIMARIRRARRSNRARCARAKRPRLGGAVSLSALHATGHRTAALRAAAAGLGAAAHGLVIAHSLAGLGAHSTDLGACPAGRGVRMHAAQHGVGRHGADVRTRLQQADVIRRCMHAALFQAVRDRLDADGRAVEAVADALVHRGAAMLCGVMGHGWTPDRCGRKSARPQRRPRCYSPCVANGDVLPSALMRSTV